MSLYLSSQKEIYHIPTVAREVFDVTGAGDTVISVYTAYHAAGLSELDASVVSNAAAGVVIGKLGAETVTPEELDLSLQSIGSFQSKDGLEGSYRSLGKRGNFCEPDSKESKDCFHQRMFRFDPQRSHYVSFPGSRTRGFSLDRTQFGFFRKTPERRTKTSGS